MTLDDLDRRILDRIQSDFPIESRPFNALAKQVDSTESDVLARVRRMQEKKVIRQIGPVFDLRRLGHVSTLCAAKVRADAVETAAAFINQFREVTHNYFRAHEFSLWFTVIASSEERIETILDRIRGVPGVLEVISLPAEQMLKINVHFPMSEDVRADAADAEPEASGKTLMEFSPRDVRILKVLDGPLPLVERPFAEAAAQAGVSEEEVLDQVRAWTGAKMVRRFGARVNHRSVGFMANGMSVWKVATEQMDRAARVMTARPEVSHCYVRPTRPGWDYNMFAMIHGMTEDDVWRVAREIAGATGLADFDVLFSTREFKKSAPEYFVEEDE